MPTLRLAITHSALTGITAQAERASTPVTSGANRNTPLLAPAGMIGSLTTNLKRSAKDCSRPQGPTTLGPRLRSEEHTSELQSLTNLVCRLLLEKKKPPLQP